MNRSRRTRFASHDILVTILLTAGSVTLFFLHSFGFEITNKISLDIICTINPMAKKTGTLFGYDSFVFLSHYFWTLVFPLFFIIDYQSRSIARAMTGCSNRLTRAFFAILIALAILFSFPLSNSDSSLERLFFYNIYTVPIFNGAMVYLIAMLFASAAQAIRIEYQKNSTG